MTGRPRVLLLDADGVLQAGPTWHADMAGLLEPGDRARVQDFLADVSVAEVRTMTGAEDFAETIRPVLQAWRVRTPADAVLALWHHVVVDPEMIARVREVGRRGVRCALATNQHAQRAAYMRRSLGYEQVLDPLFYSCEVGVAKPDLGFFTHIVGVLACPPGDILFVDDRADNVAGARAAGLRAEVFAADAGAAELSRILRAHGLA